MPTYYNPTENNVTLPYSFVSKTHKSVIEPGQTLETALYITSAELTALGIQKTLETPFARISNSIDTLVFSSASTKSASGLLVSEIIRVKTNVDILIKPNDVSNSYGYPLGSSEAFMDIRNDREIESLYITSSGSGTVCIIGLKD